MTAVTCSRVRFLCHQMLVQTLARLTALLIAIPGIAAEGARASASGSVAGFEADGALDGNRFSVERAAAWKGPTNAPIWWWQVEFGKPRQVGAILQVVGDHPFVFRNGRPSSG